MNRSRALKVLNPLLALVFLTQILSGVFHEYLDHDVFEVVHETGGIVLAGLVVLHVGLNWNWVKATFFGKKRPPASKP
ncbi:MAG TPA: DUF4405 domain-containing protein [bacterium]|nr:DUF4405 domain-containing protein [bacterium]HPJ71605.1 DUF4405 domain-containing protein [bacterium]HPQ65117.1 DUF4405 domain-containing protein [bacterium]